MAQLVQEFQKQNPSLTSAEVQQAMQIARQATGMTRGAAAGAMVGIGVGLLGVLAAGFMIFRSGGLEGGLPVSAWPMIMIGILVVALAGVVVVMRNQ
jgi:hypothetical protein